MVQEIIIAGFGGQGIMLMGQLIAYAGMLENKNVSWIPSYGPEMRGGTANCSVIVSDSIIGAPIVSEPNLLIAMNLPSLDKFTPLIKSGGTAIVNSSLIDNVPNRSDISIIKVKANDIANQLGNSKVANMVMLGSLLEATKVVSGESVMKAFSKLFTNRPELVSINQKAMAFGQFHVSESNI